MELVEFDVSSVLFDMTKITEPAVAQRLALLERDTRYGTLRAWDMRKNVGEFFSSGLVGGRVPEARWSTNKHHSLNIVISLVLYMLPLVLQSIN